MASRSQRVKQDVQAALARPTPVIVGRVDIGRKIDFRTYPQERSLTLPRGSYVSIRFPYRFRERSEDKDHWRFFLDCRMGKDHPPSLVMQKTDTPGATDAADGVLQRTFLLKKPGTSSIEFELGAEFVRSDWRTAEIRHWEQRISHGILHVDVG